ncbi:hypothetical protein F5Y02DRAFT_420603 [Annulohypoxylon stygium]|nr:hypothetical protein F5Y02DRAFT_420603 [Annulohypoxylon stygium]
MKITLISIVIVMAMAATALPLTAQQQVRDTEGNDSSDGDNALLKKATNSEIGF